MLSLHDYPALQSFAASLPKLPHADALSSTDIDVLANGLTNFALNSTVSASSTDGNIKDFVGREASRDPPATTNDTEPDFRRYQWHDVKGCWPRRLLHVPTMTSLERQYDNRYGSVREPPYSILSYTWGRWAGNADGPRLGVKGVSWTIPAVDEEHFTAESFERVIKQLGKDFDYVWVDIACIDQENNEVKMDEVGRQVGIFANARRVYIWLSRLTTDTLQSSLDSVRAFRNLVGNKVFGKRRITNLREPLALLPRLHASVTTLLDDPWFSSLWTLQEGTLRQDALFLSREGNPITYLGWSGEMPSSHQSVSLTLYHVWDFFHEFRERLQRIEDASVQRHTNAVVDVIQRTGYHLPRGQNPNIQYGIAQYRQTSFPLDRIYGIMAIYGIQVGQENPYGYTFEELEHEFAATLNATNPFIGQMFLHTVRPGENATWKITQRSRVPMAEIDPYPNEVRTLCTISATTGERHAVFAGSTCFLNEWLFVTLCRTSRSPLCEETKRLGEYYGASYWFTLQLDDYIFDEHPSLSGMRNPATEEVIPSPREAVLSKFIEAQASGGLDNPAIVLSLDVCALFGKQRVYLLLLGEIPQEKRNGENVQVSFGLVLLRRLDKGCEYTRLGVCQWRGDLDGRIDPGDTGTCAQWNMSEGLIF